MSDSYVATKIRDALVAAEGSRPRAQRILLSWLQTDDRLLRGLTAPFLKAIVTGAVERAARPPRRAAAGAGELSPEMLDHVLSQMAQRQAGPPVRPAPGGGAKPSLPPGLGRGDAPPPTKAGERHVQTMKALALIYQRRRER